MVTRMETMIMMMLFLAVGDDEVTKDTVAVVGVAPAAADGGYENDDDVDDEDDDDNDDDDDGDGDEYDEENDTKFIVQSRNDLKLCMPSYI